MRNAVRKENPDAAIAAVDAAIAQRPADAELVLVKARLLFDLARYTAAIDAAATATTRAEEAQEQARDDARAARRLDEPTDQEEAQAQAAQAHDDARVHEAHARFLRAAALRSAGRDAEAADAFEETKLAFDQLAQQPPGQNEAEQARAELSALLHTAAILRLQGHRESAAFQVRQIAAKFDNWEGKDDWIDLLTSDDAERRLYDAMGTGDQ